MYVVMISAWLFSRLVNMGLLPPVDNLVYLSVSVIKLYVIPTELLCTDSSERSTDTFVHIHLSACCVNTSWELSHILLVTKSPCAGSPMLRAPACVTAVHMGVGLPHLVEDPVLVHTLVRLSVPRTRLHRTESSGAGIARLLADAGVAVIRPNIVITELVAPSRHILTLGQQFLCLHRGECES